MRRDFSFVTMVMPYNPIPRVVLDMQTMSWALNHRADQGRMSMGKFVKQAVQANGTIDWTCGFPFSLARGKETWRVAACMSMFDEEHTMEDHKVITVSFAFVSGFDPRQAAVTKGGKGAWVSCSATGSGRAPRSPP